MSKEKYKKKKYSTEELRELYKKEPAVWLYITSKGKYGKPPNNKKD
tara:strand:+ start:504 stop:641 length:138 start_codon:yes stop_codon:yes gene_type:complete